MDRPSRGAFVERLTRALDEAERRGRTLSLMVAGLGELGALGPDRSDRFGDALLTAAAMRMHECLRPQDTVTRLEDDRFAIILDDVRDERAAGAIAARLLGSVQRPFSVGDRAVVPAANIGIASARDAQQTPLDLLTQAETALAHAKQSGSSQYATFRTSAESLDSERRLSTTDLRGALERHELQLYYQPEVELRTGRIVGAEALVHWQHPLQGTILPAAFIHLAEQTGLIVPISAWVLEEACRQARLLQRFAQRRSPFVISVNLSAPEFQEPGLLERVERTLGEAGLQPWALKLEITESAMLPAAGATIRTLRALRELGVRLAIDDFGTGYSSLSYLGEFPVDTIKIDQSFVLELGRKPEALAIVRAVTRLARALGMDVTAEGIETAGQRDLLIGLHCRRGQGHLFWKALTGDELMNLLESGATASPA
jgi:diguanylate cyclase (GGDEF)-like protein